MRLEKFLSLTYYKKILGVSKETTVGDFILGTEPLCCLN